MDWLDTRAHLLRDGEKGGAHATCNLDECPEKEPSTLCNTVSSFRPPCGTPFHERLTKVLAKIPVHEFESGLPDDNLRAASAGSTEKRSKESIFDTAIAFEYCSFAPVHLALGRVHG